MRCEKLGVSLRDVNLNQNDLLTLLPLELSKMCFNDRLLGLLKMAVLLHEVAAGKQPLIVLPASCIISCVKPYYFRSVFRSAFLRFGFHSCPRYIVSHSSKSNIRFCGGGVPSFRSLYSLQTNFIPSIRRNIYASENFDFIRR